MLLPVLLILQDKPAAAAAPKGEPPRYTRCMDLATADPAKGQADAVRWQAEGGGAPARQCLGVAYANQGRWPAAAGAFEEAAREAEVRKNAGAAIYWAQAGNAWLSAGDGGKARSALDAAIAGGTLEGLALGEVYLDRARARVAGGDADGARADIDHALETAGSDPLAWLLSATLARRMNDMPRATTDITKALRLSPDDASVQLEAGNIAAATGNETDARTAWARAVELAPGGPLADAARKALDQFGVAAP